MFWLVASSLAGYDSLRCPESLFGYKNYVTAT